MSFLRVQWENVTPRSKYCCIMSVILKKFSMHTNSFDLVRWVPMFNLAHHRHDVIIMVT